MHASVEAFDASIATLEAIAGKRLNGAARLKCLQEFAAQPEAVRRVVRAAVERARSNPIGLFVRMIEDGDHRVPPEDALRLAPKLAWARKTAPLLTAEVREDVISMWDMSPADEGLVRKAIEQSLGSSAAETA